MSVDGMVSTGATDALGVDREFPKIAGAGEVLHQYYEIGLYTDYRSMVVQYRTGTGKDGC